MATRTQNNLLFYILIDFIKVELIDSNTVYFGHHPLLLFEVKNVTENWLVLSLTKSFPISFNNNSIINNQFLYLKFVKFLQDIASPHMNFFNLELAFFSKNNVRDLNSRRTMSF